MMNTKNGACLNNCTEVFELQNVYGPWERYLNKLVK